MEVDVVLPAVPSLVDVGEPRVKGRSLQFYLLRGHLFEEEKQTAKLLRSCPTSYKLTCNCIILRTLTLKNHVRHPITRTVLYRIPYVPT